MDQAQRNVQAAKLVVHVSGVVALSLAAACETTDSDGSDGPVDLVCVADGPLGLFRPDPRTVERYRGDNGTFEDACDAAGNLVQYRCEYEQNCVGDQCDGRLTGDVIPEPLDCGGQCSDGMCETGCPLDGEAISIVELGTEGDVTLETQPDGQRYECLNASPGSSPHCSALAVGDHGLARDMFTELFCSQGEGYFAVEFADGTCLFNHCALVSEP